MFNHPSTLVPYKPKCATKIDSQVKLCIHSKVNSTRAMSDNHIRPPGINKLKCTQLFLFAAMTLIDSPRNRFQFCARKRKTRSQIGLIIDYLIAIATSLFPVLSYVCLTSCSGFCIFFRRKTGENETSHRKEHSFETSYMTMTIST